MSRPKERIHCTLAYIMINTGLLLTQQDFAVPLASKTNNNDSVLPRFSKGQGARSEKGTFAR